MLALWAALWPLEDTAKQAYVRCLFSATDTRRPQAPLVGLIQEQ